MAAVAPYDGDLDAYRSLVLADAKAERSGNKIVVEEGQKLSKAEQRKLAAQKREALKPLQKKIQEAEAQVQRFQKKIDSLQVATRGPDHLFPRTCKGDADRQRDWLCQIFTGACRGRMAGALQRI